jgi:hypothetical protein
VGALRANRGQRAHDERKRKPEPPRSHGSNSTPRCKPL